MTLRENIMNDIHPKSLLPSKAIVQEFDNRHDFIAYLDKQSKPDYADKVKIFKDEVKSIEIDPKHVETIANNVRNNLIKRGIISGTIYEGYKYDVDGDIIDYAELATGNPRCMMKPIKKYDKFFYELYINMSIPWSVTEEDITDGAIRLIETIKLLEELNVEIKLNVVLYSKGMFRSNENYLFIMHLANHLEYKDYQLILPFINGNFLRGPLFTVMYNTGHGKADDSLGSATKLENSVNLWQIDEVKLAERVILDLSLGA